MTQPTASGVTARGAALVVVAVLAGVVLLATGLDSGFLPSSSETPSERADRPADDGDGDDGTTTDPSTTSTVPPTTHVPAQVRVIVLNAGGPAGSAGTSSTALSAAGYVTLDAGNTDDAPASVVYAVPGFEADAAAVAAVLGIAAPPQPLPEPPPPGTPAGQVDVVVVLGPDFTPPA